MKTLSLYDFDGTITRKDSLFLFLKFSVSPGKWISGLLIFSIPFVLAKLGLLSRNVVKERFISYFLKGHSKESLQEKAVKFLERLLDNNIFRPSALESIESAKELGEVSIVTASLEIWMNLIASHLGVELIATNSAFKEGYFTGKFHGPNCNYEEKPIRVIAKYDLESYDKVIYYGDSKGDLAMKPIVHDFHLNKFKD